MLSQLSPSAVQTPQQSTPGMIALVLSGAIFSSPLRAFTICLALVMLVLIIVGFAMTVPVPPGAVNDPNFVKDAVLVAGVIGPWLSATACLVCGKIPRGWFSYNTIESNPVDFWTRVYFMYAIAGFFLYIALFVH